MGLTCGNARWEWPVCLNSTNGGRTGYIHLYLRLCPSYAFVSVCICDLHLLGITWMSCLFPPPPALSAICIYRSTLIGSFCFGTCSLTSVGGWGAVGWAPCPQVWCGVCVWGWGGGTLDTKGLHLCRPRLP